MIVPEVVVIGAGPAGLAVAAECTYHQFTHVRVLEKSAEHSQTIRQYYPDDKRVDAAYRGVEATCAGVLCFRDTTKDNFLAIVDELLARYPFPVHYEIAVDSIKKSETGRFAVSATNGQTYAADVVVIAIGRMGKPNRPDYFNAVPLAVKKFIQFDVRNLQAAGKRILVVGGGNSAIEFALSLSHKADVTLSYRKKNFDRLNPMNLSLLQKDEAEGRIKILRDSNVTGITEANGLPLVQFAESAPLLCDHVIYGIGGSSPAAFLEGAGIALDPRGNPELSPQLETTVENLFVAGELSVPQGKGSIIASFNSGKVIVEAILNRFGLPRQPEMVSL